MKKKVGIYVLIAALLLAAVVVLSMYFKPHPSVDEGEADFKLSATALIDAFGKDEVAANSLYGGKVLEISGMLREALPNDSATLLMIGDDTRMTGVSCYLQSGELRADALPEKGSTVTVKGICQGMLLDVVMEKCILVQDDE